MPNPYGITEVDVGAGVNAYRAGMQDRRDQILWKQQQDASALAAKNRAGTQAAVQAYAKDPKAPGAQDTLFNNLMAIDLPTAIETHKALSQMTTEQAMAAQTRMKTVSGAAAALRQLPPEQRAAYRDQMMPQLTAMGIPPDQITQVPLDDEHLDFIINQGRDTEAILKDTHPHLRNVGPGDVLIDEAHPDKVLAQSPYIKGADGTLYMRPDAQPAAPSNVPPPQAIEMLRQHPELAPQFDQKYGAGASKNYAGGAGTASPHTFP